MLLPYLITFTVQASLEMPITTFPAHINPNVYALSKGQVFDFILRQLDPIHTLWFLYRL